MKHVDPRFMVEDWVDAEGRHAVGDKVFKWRCVLNGTYVAYHYTKGKARTAAREIWREALGVKVNA